MEGQDVRLSDVRSSSERKNPFDNALMKKANQEEKDKYGNYKRKNKSTVELAEQTLSSTQARNLGGEVLVDQIIRKHTKTVMKTDLEESLDKFDEMLVYDLKP